MPALALDPARAETADATAPQLVEAEKSSEALTTVTPVDENDDSDVRTLDELVRKRARTHPHHVVVSYPSTGVEYVDYTMQQLDVFAHRVAKVYEAHVPPRTTSGEKPQVVAILGPSNLDYLVTILALTKLGHTVLFLSTRITQEAVDALLASTDASFLLRDARYSAVADAAKDALPALGVADIANGSTYNFPVDATDTNLSSALDPLTETNHVVFIIHSSGTHSPPPLHLSSPLTNTTTGSTGLPKAIPQTQKSAVANYAMHLGLKAFITLPLFHNHGISNLFRALHAVRPIHLYNADLPLTREHLTSVFSRHDFEVFYGVPYALKLLAETEEGVAFLRGMKIVMFGGSA
ncbi:acyl--CoA ligase, partial [Candidatus Bathyarchaeota archaeon]|nr:acyl--CoA ligase [Candidatus Bathyarchaeota archaeon]